MAAEWPWTVVRTPPSTPTTASSPAVIATCQVPERAGPLPFLPRSSTLAAAEVPSSYGHPAARPRRHPKQDPCLGHVRARARSHAHPDAARTPAPPPVSVSVPCSSRRRTICEDGARRLGVRAPPLSSCSYCPHAVLVFRAPTPNETDCMGRLMGVRTPWGWR